jgi:AraC-like DNA-binding protein
VRHAHVDCPVPGARGVSTLSAQDLINHFTSALVESGSRHGLAAALPEPPRDGQWTGEDFVHVMHVVGHGLGDAFFGLAGDSCPVMATQFGVEVMLLSGTLGDALDRYARFYEVITRGLTIELEIRGPKASLSIVAADPSRDPTHFLIEWYATRLISISQWLIGQEMAQVEVEFAHSRQVAQAAYTSTLAEQVTFDRPANRIIFPSRYLSRRPVREIGDLEGLVTSKFDPEHRTYIRRSWSTLVKSALRSRLFKMEPLPSMEELAHQFGVSGQTLRRGLKNEGTSYREVKAAARHEVVLNTISDPNLTLGQISVLAGFAETNGLVRAMKSWTGLSLSVLRRSVADEISNETQE